MFLLCFLTLIFVDCLAALPVWKRCEDGATWEGFHKSRTYVSLRFHSHYGLVSLMMPLVCMFGPVVHYSLVILNFSALLKYSNSLWKYVPRVVWKGSYFIYVNCDVGIRKPKITKMVQIFILGQDTTSYTLDSFTFTAKCCLLSLITFISCPHFPLPLFLTPYPNPLLFHFCSDRGRPSMGIYKVWHNKLRISSLPCIKTEKGNPV